MLSEKFLHGKKYIIKYNYLYKNILIWVGIIHTFYNSIIVKKKYVILYYIVGGQTVKNIVLKYYNIPKYQFDKLYYYIK